MNAMSFSGSLHFLRFRRYEPYAQMREALIEYS